METGRHAVIGDITGNPAQPTGRHLEYGKGKKIGLIPLGSRTRVVGQQIHMVEEGPDRFGDRKGSSS